MGSKSNNIDREMCLYALLGLFVGVIASSCFQGLLKNLEQWNRQQFGQNLVQLFGTFARIIHDDFFTLAIKFHLFFIARCLQFRYLSSLLAVPSSMSMLFWVAFTRSISSMSSNPL